MQIFSDISSFRETMGQKADSAVVTIGKFDGIHLGHQKLLSEVLSARDRGEGIAVVFGFEKPVASFFTGKPQKVLTTNSEKRKFLSEMGFDCLIEFPVNEESLGIEPEVFIREILSQGLMAVRVVAGPDCSFGHKGRGNVALLREMEEECGYRTTVVDKLRFRDEIISSTLVRGCILDGDMEKAGQLLGRPYSLEGGVCHGQQLGRPILGMPTANLIPDPDKILPPFGVYFTRVHVGEACYNGVTNIGCRPTVSEGSFVSAETFLYDFEGDLYGQEIRLDLLHRQREEMKFEDISGLKARMHKDMRAGEAYFDSCRDTSSLS